ncbi:MAG: hypothetical protein AAF108_05685 [Planctomycetota bacterium]
MKYFFSFLHLACASSSFAQVCIVIPHGLVIGPTAFGSDFASNALQSAAQVGPVANFTVFNDCSSTEGFDSVVPWSTWFAKSSTFIDINGSTGSFNNDAASCQWTNTNIIGGSADSGNMCSEEGRITASTIADFTNPQQDKFLNINYLLEEIAVTSNGIPIPGFSAPLYGGATAIVRSSLPEITLGSTSATLENATPSSNGSFSCVGVGSSVVHSSAESQFEALQDYPVRLTIFDSIDRGTNGFVFSEVTDQFILGASLIRASKTTDGHVYQLASGIAVARDHFSQAIRDNEGIVSANSGPAGSLSGTCGSRIAELAAGTITIDTYSLVISRDRLDLNSDEILTQDDLDILSNFNSVAVGSDFDINRNGVVEQIEIEVIQEAIALSGIPVGVPGDVNGDGVIDCSDPIPPSAIFVSDISFVDPGYNVGYDVDQNGYLEPEDEIDFLSIRRCAFADINNDGKLLGDDFAAWLTAFVAGESDGDQNCDGQFLVDDFNAWLQNFIASGGDQSQIGA